MYSIVLLSALSAGSDVTPPIVAAPFNTVPGALVAHGCGCTGVTPVGFYGSCTGSCYGSSCYGSSCHGGHFTKKGGFLGGRSSCHGCSGYSCSGYNCFSSGYSAAYSTRYVHPADYGHPNHYAYPSAHAFPYGYSCAGTCHGGAMVMYGSTWGPPIGMPPYTLHGYNTGLAPVWGSGAPVVFGNYVDPRAVYGTTTNPNAPPVMTVPVAPIPKAGGSDSVPNTPMGANLKFTLPADAKLFVDGKPAPGSGAERSFYTPPLTVGQKFFYDVKAEMMVAGELVVEEKKVIVEAGASLTETFPKLTAALARASTVAGK